MRCAEVEVGSEDGMEEYVCSWEGKVQSIATC